MFLKNGWKYLTEEILLKINNRFTISNDHINSDNLLSMTERKGIMIAIELMNQMDNKINLYSLLHVTNRSLCYFIVFVSCRAN